MKILEFRSYVGCRDQDRAMSALEDASPDAVAFFRGLLPLGSTTLSWGFIFQRMPAIMHHSIACARTGQAHPPMTLEKFNEYLTSFLEVCRCLDGSRARNSLALLVRHRETASRHNCCALLASTCPSWLLKSCQISVA